MGCKALTLIVLLTIITIGVLFSATSYSWVGPPYNGPWPTEDYRFEAFGPRLDYVFIEMYSNPLSQWEAFFYFGEIDLMDRPLTKGEYEAIVNHPEHHAIAEYNSTGMYWLDLNNAEWTNDNENDIIGDPGDVRNPLGDPTLIELPPCHPYLPGGIVRRGSQFRLAIAHLIDREAIIRLSGERFIPLWTHLPETFRPGTWIVDAFGYPYDPALAAQILDWAGYVDTDGDGWRNYDSDGDGDIDANDANIVLKFYTRLDLFRKSIGDFVQPGLESLGIQVQRFEVTGYGAWFACMVNKKHNMYTSGWPWDRREPTIHYAFFHSSKYWHPGSCPNYNGINDSILDYYSELVQYAPNMTIAKQACHYCQTRMAEPDAVYNIPIATRIEAKGYRKYRSPPGTEPEFWLGFVNTVGRGINTGPIISAGQSSIDTMLNAHGLYSPTGGIIKYGWSQTWVPTSLNPFIYAWFWDAEIIYRAYDCLLAVNPYNPMGGGAGEYPPGDLPWVAKKWKIEQDLPSESVRITFWLRDDVYFHDGTKLTAKDVYYTVQLGHWIAEDHPEYGWTGLPPTWWDCIKDLTPEYDTGDIPGVGVDMPDGPNGYVIVFNYNVLSSWALWWAGGIPIVPKHKWWDVFYPNPTGVDGFAPDPSLIGTGPWKFYPHDINDPEYYTPGDHIKMDMNPNFHNRYIPEADWLKVSFTSNALDVYIDNSGPTSLTVTVDLYIYGDGCWKVENVRVPRRSWGVALIQGLSPGEYEILAIIEQYYVMNWAKITLQPEPPHPAADIAGSTIKYRRLPRDQRVDYKDLFWMIKTYGQSVSEDP